MATYGIPTKAIHEQWLGLVQVPNQTTKRLSAMQLQLEGLLRLPVVDQSACADGRSPAPNSSRN
jgi:hypothetical protein